MFDPNADDAGGDGEPNPGFDQIAGAHGLLASYPFASATPISHVGRHLGPMSLPTPIPSLAQPHHPFLPQPAMMPEEYLHQGVPADGPSRYAWDQTKDVLVHGLQAEAMRIPLTNPHPTPSTSLNSQTHWTPSSYRTSDLSNTVLRSVALGGHPARPALLPPSLAPVRVQTSLSNALGNTSPERPPNERFETAESSGFFDGFLRETVRQMQANGYGYANANANHDHDHDNFVPAPTSSSARSSSAAPTSQNNNNHRHSPSPTVTAVGVSPAPSSTTLLPPSTSFSAPPKPFPSTPMKNKYRTAPPLIPEESPDPLMLHEGETRAYLNPQMQTQTPLRKLKRKSPADMDDAVSQGSGKKRIASKNKKSGLLQAPAFPSSSSKGPFSGVGASLSPAIQRSVSGGAESATTRHDADAYGGYEDDDSGSDWGTLDAEGEIEPAVVEGTPASIGTAAGSPRKRKRGEGGGGGVRVGRDDRVPLQKLSAFIEDIFEAEDSLPATTSEIPLSQLPSSISSFFSPLTSDRGPLLSATSVIPKLAALIGQVANPSKRSRRNAMSSPVKGGRGGGGGGGGGEPVRLAELDEDVLGRVLRLLGRSARMGEDLDPFAAASVSVVRRDGTKSAPGSPKKKKTKKASKVKAKGSGTGRSSRSRSRSRTAGEEEDDDHDGSKTESEEVDPDAEPAAANGVGEGEVDDEDLERLSRALEVANESVVAASCAILLLAADSLPKKLYSEDLILSSVTTIKNALSKIIYPFVEGLSDIHGHNSPILEHTLRSTSPLSAIHRTQIGSLFQSLTGSIQHITSLVQRASPSSIYSSSLLFGAGTMTSSGYITMSENIVIQMVYIAIGPFFVVEGSTGTGTGKGSKGGDKEKGNVVSNALGGPAAMRAARLGALSLVRNIFEANPEHRSWIIEEILGNLIKLSDLKQKTGQFRLRDGQSIHTVTALLLQLVQTSAHDIALQAKDFARKRRELSVQYGGDASKKSLDKMMLDIDSEEMKVYMSSLDNPYKYAQIIFKFLTTRAGSGKAKNAKNANESEYRAILDMFIGDLLTVLYWPEWPGAALLVVVASKILSKTLEDVSSTAAATADTNGMRAIALDHLGPIAARLRTSQLRNVKSENDDVLGLPSLETIMSTRDHNALDTLIAAHEEVTKHLGKSSVEDSAINDSGREMGIAVWGQEMATILTRSNTLLSEMEQNDRKDSEEYRTFKKMATRLQAAFRTIWKPSATDVFTQFEPKRADLVSEIFSVSQVLRNAFEPMLSVILSSLDASAVMMRTKALRALGEVVLVDPSILQKVNVRKAIESHMSDSSPAVREAAVDLVGKYIISLPHVANAYYPLIADRIADTGLGVRKRVIKLLKNIYTSESSIDRRIDICARLVFRMLDEDDTVKDLASKTVGELWFGVEPTKSSTQSKASKSEIDSIHSKLLIITGVVAKFSDHQSPLEDLLRQLAHTNEGEAVPSVMAQYEEVCDALIDRLLDGTDAQSSVIVNGIRSVHLFTAAHPGVITNDKALTLLPYLKNPSNADEQIISDYLLKIYRLSIPTLPKSASKFGQDLQTTLQPMITKPSTAGGVAALQESIATLCTVVKHLTHNYTPLIGLLKSCNAKLQGMIAQAKSGPLPPQQLSALVLLIYIISLLCEHCNFDELRTSDPNYAVSLDAVTKLEITHYVYESLLSLHSAVEDATTRSRVMQCLGFLFRAYPLLMIEDESARLMDTVFTSPDMDARARLLRIIHDFLMSESARFMAQEKANNQVKKGKKKDVDMEELVGNTTGFADSGVSSAIVQRYIDQILACCVINHPGVQSSAIDILGFVVRQGLAHPLQCMPAIIALETSPSPPICAKALNYHTIIYHKHATMTNTRQIDSARKSFEYQELLGMPVVGYRVEPTYCALLNPWYTLVRDKRATRQEWLRVLVKSLDLDGSQLATSQESLDFIRYMAENFASLEYQTQEEVLTVVRHVTNVLSDAGTGIIEVIGTTMSLNAEEVASQQAASETTIDFARTCTCIAMLLILKGHLKSMYGLSEDKCMKWDPRKKSALGDKAAVRRREVPLVWDRVPYATRQILGREHQEEQYQATRALWDEEGVSPEPVDDME